MKGQSGLSRIWAVMRPPRAVWVGGIFVLVFGALAYVGVGTREVMHHLGETDLYTPAELYVGGAVLLLLAFQVATVSKRWLRDYHSLYVFENAVILMFLAASLSTAFALADFGIHLHYRDSYLVDPEYASHLRQVEQATNDEIGSEARGHLALVRRIQDTYSKVLARKIDCPDPFFTLPAATDELRLRCEHINDGVTGFPPKPSGHDELVFDLEGQQLRFRLGFGHASFSPGDLLAERRRELERDLAIVELGALHVPLVTFIDEWSMDFAGSRPFLVKPVGMGPRLLALSFECGKIFFFGILLTSIVSRISQPDKGPGRFPATPERDVP